jgi:hypothetical protein
MWGLLDDARHRRLLWACLGAGVTLRVLVALAVPTYYAPDEMAHVHVVQRVLEVGGVPALPEDPTLVEEELDQPPVYYVLLAPLHALTGALGAGEWVRVRALRLVSVGLWAATLLLHYRVLDNLGLLRDRSLHRAVSGVSLLVMTFLPTFVFVSSATNNDSLVLALGTLLLVLLTGEFAHRRAVDAGVVLGAAALTKLTAGLYALAVPAVLLARRPATGQSRRLVARRVATVAAVSAALFAVWVAGNLARYGAPAPTIIHHRPWPSLATALVDSTSYMVSSFWAVAGVTNNVHHVAFEAVGWGATLLAVAGAARASRAGALSDLDDALRRTLLAFAGVLLAAVVLVLYFGVLAHQAQGRYLFYLLSPTSILLGVGLAGVTPSEPRRALAAAAVVGPVYATAFAGWAIQQM